ncbi:MAG: hypothetical protein JWO30_3230 [Fibrobacteres bacterium]|nr:hypothetical protein [Fibrobacterota bacterium]
MQPDRVDTTMESRGMTLLEICVALAVIGILAALSVNPMKNYLRRLDFRNSCQNIKRLIQTAQSKAMANPNLHIGVYFDLGATPNKAFLFEDKINPAAYNYDGSGDSPYLQPEVLKKKSVFRALPGYPDEVVFRGDGSAWKSFKIVVTDGTLNDTLDVLASTGRVRLGK